MIVYTSLYGGYDTPKPPRPHPGVSEWRLYTDDASIYAPGWRVVTEPRPEFEHPRMKAKWRKCHPPTDTHQTLYLDASIRLRDPELLEHAVDLLARGAWWAMYLHPERSNIDDEVQASIRMPKYARLGPKMIAQAASYARERSRQPGSGPMGLWAAGIIARNAAAHAAVLQAGADWFHECELWTYQDQISLPVVLWRHEVLPTPMTLGGGLWRNPHFSIKTSEDRP